MRILTGRDHFNNPETWIEITQEEYLQNKSDIENYMYAFEQDTNLIGFYKRLVKENDSGNS